jgi:hypothetical protein
MIFRMIRATPRRLFLASDKAPPFSGTVMELEQFPTGALAAPARQGPTP